MERPPLPSMPRREEPSYQKPINNFLPYRVRPERREKIEEESVALWEKLHRKNLASRGNVQKEIKERVLKMEAGRIKREEQWRRKTQDSPLLRDHHEMDVARERRSEAHQAIKGKLLSQRRLLDAMTGAPDDPELQQSPIKGEASLAERLALQMRELNRRKREVERERETIAKLQREELALLERQFKDK